MWLFWCGLVINVFIFRSFAAHIAIKDVKRDLDDTYDGYRCGRRVFTREFLENAANEAVSRYSLHSRTQDLSAQPRIYKGPFTFGTGTSIPTLWEFSTNEDVPGHSPAIYSLVLDTTYGGGSRIAGVLRRREGNDLKCIKEVDLSEVSGHKFATGYRCPMDIYSFDAIEAAIDSSLENSEEVGEKLQHVKVSDFSYSQNQNSLFDTLDHLLMRRLTPSGLLHHTALGAVIINNHSQFVGMVYRRNDKYIRCKLTVHNQIRPRFIGPALVQESKNIDPGSLDVFKCGHYFFSSEEILKSADGALEGLRKKMTQHSRGVYPAVYESSITGETKTLYQWPIKKVYRNRAYHIPAIVPFQGHFALIDDFSDVYNVIQMKEPYTSIECHRGHVKKEVYEMAFMTGQKRKKRKSRYEIYDNPSI